MKIVQINAVFGKGSTGRMVMEIHNYLRLKGFESIVFSTSKAKQSEGLYRIGCAFDYKLHAFLSRIFGLQGYFSILSTLIMLCKLRRINPDVVHLHNLHSNYINVNLLMRFLSAHKIKTVLTLHDCWFFTGHCCHFTDVECYKWRDTCDECVQIKDYNKSYFFDNADICLKNKSNNYLSLSKLTVIGNSLWTMERAKQSVLNSANRIVKIYNWINLEVFYKRDSEYMREKFFFNKDEFIVLGVSQEWSLKKGLDVFIDLAIKRPCYKFILIGAVDKYIVLPKNIVVLGFVQSQNQLAEYYSLVDVLLSTSTQETFGLVSAESLACGTPIVVTNSTASPELVGENCGFVAEKGDYDAYLNALDEVKFKTKQYFSRYCIEFARRNFEMKNNIDQYINEYIK